MYYVFDDAKYYKKCQNYLITTSVAHQTFEVGKHYIISVFDNSIKEYIEDKEAGFKNSINLSIEHGYLVTKRHKDKTVINVRGVEIGGDRPVFISGPCSIESKHILKNIATEVKKLGVDILRGGAFKPRTSPYDFQGLGKSGVEIIYEIGKELDIPIVTEVMDVRDLDYMLDKVDILQVGSRNMYNYSLLKELGKVDKPILLKRGLSATIKEFLLSAEYIMLGGNEKVILCERGIRTFDSYTRNTMDIASISLLKEMSHLPVIADPSHATGISSLVIPLAKASLEAGADGLLIESHISPNQAWCDGKQSIYPTELKEIIKKS